MKERPFDRSFFWGLFLTVLVGMILFYFAYVSVAFLLAHIGWVIVVFVVVVIFGILYLRAQ
jgi:hypothetical protein